MLPVTQTPGRPDPDARPRPQVAGERRLDRPPSDRYGAAAAPGPTPTAARDASEGGESGAPSAARGVAFGTIAAIAGAGLIVLLGGAMAVSAGLLVAAAAIGYAVGLAVVAGAGDVLSRPSRPWTAAALAGLGTALGQVGLWLYARSEGGVLPLTDYLGETFGVLVPLELLLAAGMAWWRAR